jgi:RHS repeat-associated protein
MTLTDQAMVSYAYDNADRLTQITKGSATVQIAYDNVNRRTSLTLPNGVVTEYSYDNASRLTGLTYKNGVTPFGNLSYEYDSAGRVTKLGGSFARTNLPQAVTSTNYNEANRQLGFGSQMLAYDLNGNLTSDRVNTYAWNTRDEMVSMSGPGLSASFQYDALGRRINKTINGTSTTLVYDGANAVQEKSGSQVTANILNGGIDEVFQRIELDGTWSPIVDMLGSTWALTDTAGAAQTQYTYEPFGKTTTSGGSSSNSAQFTGRENDGTGLFYYRARYYSAASQRFVSEDPIRYGSGDTNFFAYVANGPTNRIDPFGLDDADRAFEERINPPAPSSNAWYWSHNESADNESPPQLGARKVEAYQPSDLTELALAGTIAIPLRRPHPIAWLVGGCAAIALLLFAQRGKQNLSNEWVDEAKRLFGNNRDAICRWLDEQYKKASAAEKLKIKIAQKALGCRRISADGCL